MKRWLVSLVAVVAMLVALTLQPLPVVVYAQTAPKIAWAHAGTNVTHFQIQIATNWVVDAGLPTPSGGVYEYTLPALPSGTYTIAVKACYGSDCATSSTLTVVKMVAAGSKALNFYWVDDNGTETTWANCKSDSPLSGASACTLATANTNAAAGQTVWFRGGTYNYNTNGGSALYPDNSGASDAKIVFAAYPGESPVIQQANTTNKAVGLRINGNDYIVVRGLTFHNFQNSGMLLMGDADYNEIAYCTFTHDTAYEEVTDRSVIGYNATTPWANYNWLHHNYFSQNRFEPCAEGADTLRIGMAISPYAGDNYNTVEDNYFEYAAHSHLVVYSRYNVIRNNIFHNEPWIQNCTVYSGGEVDSSGYIDGSTSTSSVTIGTGSKTFTIATGLSADRWANPLTVVLAVPATPAQAMFGTITSYNSTTGELVVNVTKVNTGASGTFTSWIASVRNYPAYVTTAYNGLYSHRNISIGDSVDTTVMYELVEGNRAGFAGVNPNNGGATNMDIGVPGNLVRYNAVYAGMASGIFFKNAYPASSYGGIDNRVYNNTSYANGTGYDWTVYGGLNAGYHGQGIAQYRIGEGNTNNVIKNNVVYANGHGDICSSGTGNPSCTAESWDTVVNNLTGTDPLFVNPALTDPTSQNILTSVHGYTTTPIPDLRVQAGSAAVNAGTYLTQANGAGTGSTTLIVDDAAYFQDGTRGSSLSSIQADWIAVGTVGNISKINSIGGNTITLATALTWADDASVWLYKKSDGVIVLIGTAPDIGAHEYGIGIAVAPTGLVIR